MLLFLQDLPESQRIRLGDLYHRHRQLLWRVAMALLQNREDAEDAVHRAFERTARHLHRLEGPDSLSTRGYLIVATERCALDILRERRRQTELSPDLPGLEVPYSGENALAACILQLPARQRQVILLRHHHGYTQRETAAILGVTRGTVQNTEAAAKEKLRELLKERGVEV